MKKLILIQFYLTLTIAAFSQVKDYKADRKNVSTLSCTQVDSLQLAETRQGLKQYDTTKITENIHLYYKDLGWCYYRLYLMYKQDYYLNLSVQAYEKCVAHKPDYGPVLWDLAFEYALLKNCKNSSVFLEKYLSITPLEYQQKGEQIKSLKGKCL